MITLNLETKNGSQRAIKEYLEATVSQALAYKINNGVKIEKDGKTLINKKDLDGFWAYATQKARETKEEYVENETVFGWAVHYFEEREIEGTLYNEDGTKYSKPVPKLIQPVHTPSVSIKTTPPKPQVMQFSLFDPIPEEDPETIIEPPSEEPCTLNVDEETGEVLPQEHIKKTIPLTQCSPLYQKYMKVQNQYPQAVIAYRLGDFFEIFGENAVNVANRMELTLTGRDCGLDERVPMVGFPYHISDTYFKKIAQFSPLVVVDNNEITPYVLEEETPIKQENKATVYENNEENDDFEEERALQKFFDKDALCALYELFDYNLDMQ